MMNHLLSPGIAGNYNELKICSNRLYDGAQLMLVGSNFPVVIKKGVDAQPLIWLNGRASADGFKLVPVVSASVSVHPLFRVDRSQNEISVFIGPQKVIHLFATENEAVVDFIDLNLLGFAVKGNENQLEAAGVKFSENSFYGISAMLNLAPPQKQQSKKKQRQKSVGRPS